VATISIGVASLNAGLLHKSRCKAILEILLHFLHNLALFVNSILNSDIIHISVLIVKTKLFYMVTVNNSVTANSCEALFMVAFVQVRHFELF